MDKAFNLHAPALVAIVGGGGKTSLMFALARGLPGRVVATTTTRIFAAQVKLAPAVCYAHDLSELGNRLDEYGRCLVVGEVGIGKDKGKALGVRRELPGRLLARPDVDFVLVEADGSRMQPIKAPAAHEPVIPLETTLVIPVVGIDAIGKRIQEAAHRPELLCSVIGDQCSVDSVLTPEMVATLLTHPQGGLKGAPAGAQVIPFINKVETADQLAVARQIAQLVLPEPRITQVIIGAVQTDQPIREVHRRVTAVVLAAGESNRMGTVKQLLPWGETTVLGQVLRNLKATAVQNIVVVTGHEAERVAAAAAAEGVESIFNPQFASGEMLSSLQTAVRQLPQHVAAVLVVLADQPMVEPETINRLLEAYWQQKGELIAPVYKGHRGNPVIIGRSYFAELLDLPPGSAPRHLLKRYQDDLYLVPVETDTILQDLDQPDDYKRWHPPANKKAAPGDT